MMGKLLVWGGIITWLAVFFACDGIHGGWMIVTLANCAAMGWALLWLTLAMIFDA